MKKLGFLLLLASSTALAGGAGKPPSELDMLNHFHNSLVNYSLKNKQQLPQFTDCLKWNGNLPIKPDRLKLNSCGIAKENGHIFIDISTENFGYFTTPEPYLLGNTTRQEAETRILTALEQYKMRHELGQPASNVCAIGGKYCKAEIQDGTVQRLYYKYKDGIRLMYDGATIKDWLKE